MMKPFDCYVGIDWSGDKRALQKGLKVAVAMPGSIAPQLVDGPGYKGRWSRAEIANWIGNLTMKTKALIGLDFAFGFPAVPLLKQGTNLDWNYVEEICRLDSNFYGGAFFRSQNSAHCHLVNSPWLPRRNYSADYLRRTEMVAKQTVGARPQSIFNAIGAAQVGPSSISGMRMLLWLRENFGENISIWPLDQVQDHSVVVEIFPRYFPLSRGLSAKLAHHDILNAALRAFASDPILIAPNSEDEADALLSAAALRYLSRDRSLFELPPESIRSQGWIFGVPIQSGQPL